MTVYDLCITKGIANKGRPWCPITKGAFRLKKDSKTWGICEDDCPRSEGWYYIL